MLNVLKVATPLTAFTVTIPFNTPFAVPNGPVASDSVTAVLASLACYRGRLAPAR